MLWDPQAEGVARGQQIILSNAQRDTANSQRLDRPAQHWLGSGTPQAAGIIFLSGLWNRWLTELGSGDCLYSLDVGNWGKGLDLRSFPSSPVPVLRLTVFSWQSKDHTRPSPWRFRETANTYAAVGPEGLGTHWPHPTHPSGKQVMGWLMCM